MKTINNIIFCLIFIALITVPVFFTDLEKNKASEIDNDFLPELDMSSAKGFTESAEEYLSRRIGFRTQALNLYQYINHELFSIMEHPDYMYGSNGHIFYKADLYINDWQHLNLDEEWVNNFADGLKGFQDYAEAEGKTFIYMLLPDKKTVYPEYFPKGYNILGDVSRTDMLLSALEEREVNHYWALDTMLEGKETMLVNNMKYDVTHWNENGTFIVLQELFEKLSADHPAIKPLLSDDFDITEEIEKKLPNSEFIINDPVPLYTPKKNNAVKRTAEVIDQVIYPEKTHHYISWHTNDEASDAPSILVIHDSYLAEKEKFFTGSFSSVLFMHRYNYYNQEVFEYYVDHFDPDIILFETPERSLATEKLNLQREYSFEN